MTRWQKPEEFVEFPGVTFKATSRSGKAILCRFSDGRERWVPFSQIEDGCPAEPGETGSLSVTKWIVGQWEQEEAEPDKSQSNDRSALVRFENVVALRETDKGLKVRVGDKEEWLAKSQIPDASDVRYDGDRGVLLLPRWVAEDKGFVESTKQRSVVDDVDEVVVDDDIPF